VKIEIQELLCWKPEGKREHRVLGRSENYNIENDLNNTAHEVVVRIYQANGRT
jgi:hypothetical protein